MLCAVSSQIGVLIAGRALQGAALAVVPLGISIMRDELPPVRVLSSVALMSSTLGIGAAVGLPVAALVIEHFNWHTMFWVSGALGVLDIVLVLSCVPESPLRSRGRFDVLGTLGLTCALVALLLAVTQGADWGWMSVRTVGLLVAAVVISLFWGAYELRTVSPMVDLRVSARPAVLLTNIAALLIGFAFYANSLATAQMVQEPRSTGYGLGASIVVSGLCLLPGGLSMVALSPVSARISAKHGPKVTLALASALMAVGYAVRFFTSHELWMIIGRRHGRGGRHGHRLLRAARARDARRTGRRDGRGQRPQHPDALGRPGVLQRGGRRRTGQRHLPGGRPDRADPARVPAGLPHRRGRRAARPRRHPVPAGPPGRTLGGGGP